MDKVAARGMAEHKEAERWTRETEQAIHRVCEALSGTCVMMHECRDGRPGPHHDVCNIENCSAYRAAFADSASTNEEKS